ncbi:MAG: hypothetical protein K8S13_19850 [Desulfobacula sp.]|uniref:glycoside hydrolase family 20 zincin-like fold domain-containing protein n=1 Tax=Desulfobacula sp. TaxID=2593537 RepID=UPI0025BB7CFC|nr:glycoside hydrolase family 20 zincin-like fold domain-containing protein [Desulfobacula sp.]MCD4722091.1 hypothetical protein [Desulfobacula sp.]
MAFVLNSVTCTYAADLDNADLVLNVDKKKGARVFYKGIPVLMSLGSFFSFYKRGLTGSRERIGTGPWRGVLKGKLSQETRWGYKIAGSNKETGIDYSIRYAKTDFQSIILEINLVSQARRGNFSYDIFKLNSGIFKGSKVSAYPVSFKEIKELPEKPRTIDKRILLKNKQTVTIRSELCDIELSDLSKANSIILADFRNIPWDKTKSFYFGSNVKGIETGKTYTFKYKISFLRPSLPPVADQHRFSENFISFSPNIAQLNQENKDRFDTTGLFSIPCKDERMDEGSFALPGKINIFTDQNGMEMEILSKEFLRMAGTRCIIQPLQENISTPEGIIFSDLDRTVKIGDNSGKERFEININKKRIIIHSSDKRGRLYGVYKLLSMFQKEEGQWRAKCGKFRDWPDLETRGMLIAMLPSPRLDQELFKRYIDALSIARVNMIVFWHQPQDLLKWKKNTFKNYWSKKEMAELASYARSLHMDVWGGMISKFSTEDFSGLDIADGSTFYNPFKETSYQILFSLYDEIIENYNPSGILIGHDEIRGLSIYEKNSGIQSHLILSDTVNRIQKWLSSRQVETMMAGDMLLDFKKWEKKLGNGGVNSGNPLYNSGDTYKAVDLISKDIMVFDWHYKKAEDYSSLKYFADKGFKVFGGTWHNPEASCAMAEDVKKYKCAGIIGTDFGFWRTLSPAATTLYTSICGWSSNHIIPEDDKDILGLSQILKGRQQEDVGKPGIISLKPYANESILDDIPGDGSGFLDMGPYADLRNFKPGKRDSNGFGFEIPQNKDGGGGCLVVGYDGEGNINPIDRITINLGSRKVGALAFFHTCLLEEPGYRNWEIGEYVVMYDNGKKETIRLIQNWNITDIRSSKTVRQNDWTFNRMPQVLLGSDVAWSGVSVKGLSLNIQKYVWKNPHPEYPIKQIVFRAKKIKQKYRMSLLALTAME